MGMDNKNFDVDAMLKRTLGCSEKPSPALILQLKKERLVVKKRRFTKPSVLVAVAIITVLSLSAVAFAAVPAIMRQLETRVIHGEQFVNYFSEYTDGEFTVSGIEIDFDALEAAEDRLIVVEVDGVTRIISDELHLDSLDEAIGLMVMDNILTPSFMPAGFVFERATITINPLVHSVDTGAGTHMFADFSRRDENIRVQFTQWDTAWGMSVFSSDQVDIVINGHQAAMGGGVVAMIANDIMYIISINEDATVTQDELIAIAESLA